MKLFVLLLAGMLVGGPNDNEPTDYKTAFKKAQNGDKPLLVFVSAEWCPPCQTMKSSTIPKLVQKDAFDGFHYATVDLGKEQELGRRLIGERGIPQLIMFEKKDDKWQRRYLRGMQSPESVEAFIAQSEKAARTASAPKQKAAK